MKLKFPCDKRYPCGQCDYQATEKGILDKYVKSKHLKQNYLCTDCDKQFRQYSNLRRHKQSAHNDKRYPCGQCDYQATAQTAGQSKDTSVVSTK